jgi:hypothetical protein
MNRIGTNTEHPSFVKSGEKKKKKTSNSPLEREMVPSSPSRNFQAQKATTPRTHTGTVSQIRGVFVESRYQLENRMLCGFTLTAGEGPGHLSHASNSALFKTDPQTHSTRCLMKTRCQIPPGTHRSSALRKNSMSQTDKMTLHRNKECADSQCLAPDIWVFKKSHILDLLRVGKNER